MLRASLGKVVHTVKRAGTYAAKVPPQELHIIAVHVRAVLSAQPASLRCLPLGSKLFQGIATMTYTRSHTRPSQKDLGCVVYPLNNKSLL